MTSTIIPLTIANCAASSWTIKFDMTALQIEFVALRSRKLQKLFEKLDVSKATGPDRIPASILKRLAKFLAVPFAKVCRRLYAEACWPQAWKIHHICPLYKRGSAFLAGNYRGIHLTTILSKIFFFFLSTSAFALRCRSLLRHD